MSENNKTDLSVIHEVVCDFFKIGKMEIFDKTRVHEIIIPRQFFQYLCRKLNPEYIVTSTYIGKYYSDVTGHVTDHSTILHSHKTISNYIDTYDDYKEIEQDLIYEINKKITSYKKDNEPKEYCNPKALKHLITSN